MGVYGFQEDQSIFPGARMIMITNRNEIKGLLDVANAGLDALRTLFYQVDFDRWKVSGVKDSTGSCLDFPLSTYLAPGHSFSRSKFILAEPPFIPFKLSTGHKVSLSDDRETIDIGCDSFPVSKLLEAFTQLKEHGGSVGIASYRKLLARIEGVRYFCWAEDDIIVDFTISDFEEVFKALKLVAEK